MNEAYSDALRRFDMQRKMSRCPVCNAAPGDDCTEKGEPVRWVHWSRYDTKAK